MANRETRTHPNVQAEQAWGAMLHSIWHWEGESERNAEKILGKCEAYVGSHHDDVITPSDAEHANFIGLPFGSARLAMLYMWHCGRLRRVGIDRYVSLSYETPFEPETVTPDVANLQAQLRLSRDEATALFSDLTAQIDRTAALQKRNDAPWRALYLTRAWCIAACSLAVLLVWPVDPWRAVALGVAGVLGPFLPALLTRRKGGEP